MRCILIVVHGRCCVVKLRHIFIRRQLDRQRLKVVPTRLNFQALQLFAVHASLSMLLKHAKAAHYSDKIDISRQSSATQIEESIREVTAAAQPTPPALDRLHDLFGHGLVI